MNKRNRIFAIFLLLLYTFFFVSTNLFVHSHQGPTYKIVHSHPWSGKTHNHSANEFQLISLLSSGNCIVPDVQKAPEPYVALAVEREDFSYSEALPLHTTWGVSGRAPPYTGI